MWSDEQCDADDRKKKKMEEKTIGIKDLDS